MTATNGMTKRHPLEKQYRSSNYFSPMNPRCCHPRNFPGVKDFPPSIGYNQANQRTGVTRTAGDYVNYTYDNAGELLRATGYEPAGTLRLQERLIIELYTPTIAREMPMKNKRWDSFSATNQVKARLHQTKPPNALPASERCPGQPSAGWEVLSLSMRSSHSVMAATIPAMSAQSVAASVPPATPEWNW